MQQLFGILIVLVCVFGGFMLHGGIMSVIWQPVELLIICGAAVGAIVLGNPQHVLTEMGGQIKRVGMRKKYDAEFQRQLLLLMYELLITASQGLKALDEHVEAPRVKAPCSIATRWCWRNPSCWPSSWTTSG
ncbi:hypothetical protein JOS77_21750 [Chromobacterium haemolyticum]|nr:hypothetical protein JOS77_21750 [Chromobacterium haemolyticum]